MVSRTPDPELPHPNSTLLAGEAADTVRALKERGDGNLVVLGSGALVRAPAAAGLVNRYVFTTIPVVLDRRVRLFEARTPSSRWSGARRPRPGSSSPATACCAERRPAEDSSCGAHTPTRARRGAREAHVPPQVRHGGRAGARTAVRTRWS
ncbi:dihydrofolate reductase family protein [Quadrisphaera sp. DSM 44207]|uniref:dihydrofolate reductase family protein n=1 Tax=Quadrisphaera sp. DSM 44207 TaxID=1881057 RepID=UPI00350FBC88